MKKEVMRNKLLQTKNFVIEYSRNLVLPYGSAGFVFCFLSIENRSMDLVFISKNNLSTKGGTFMRENKDKSNELAGRMYDTSDYHKNDELSKGLAMTHEQASDSYVEGEVGGKIERSSGAEDELNNRGYQ
jgi:hypothetical protein